jgi:hypothetical protein
MPFDQLSLAPVDLSDEVLLHVAHFEDELFLLVDSRLQHVCDPAQLEARTLLVVFLTATCALEVIASQ